MLTVEQQYFLFAIDKDLLLSAVSDNGTATYYTYNAYGRVESVREEAPDGNIMRKGDVGDMVYTNPNRPYAATGNTPEKEACIHSGLQVGYTAADRPAWIE
ncbi:hypothetical protein KSY34_18680, partial [Phocaeicola coprocola]|nr:hypothetical protein [Phocaeicola coprocola]MBV4009978.1 hypothetical protein [Phocaeicola coprocola]MBV4034449.1 hypothetical protein [Phocaeicola coprocola]MBV4041047.1 hypothetical protein [Phocaeicola coprocola]MBV4062601.1 hypothetical protein [Phocaeicola coprocola]